MKKYFKHLLIILVSTTTLAQNPVLKHSYNFEDGTARDEIGQAHGQIIGGKVIDGQYISSSHGHYIDLPADKININIYKAISLEFYLGAGHLNSSRTMISYFGDSIGNIGVNYLFQSMAQLQSSMTGISCKNTTEPWKVSTNVFGKIVKDLKYHHVVTTFDNHEIKFYIDGVLANKNTVEKLPNNIISNISNELAFLCKTGYREDPTWFGAIDQFNIYEGILDSNTINKASKKYLNNRKEISEEIKIMLSNVVENPGFRPESELSSTFIQTYKNSLFNIYPTIIRTIDTISWSETSAKKLSESVEKKLKIKVRIKNSELNPGELEGRGQFEFFTNDMNKLGNIIESEGTGEDYNMVMEILFAPKRSKYLQVFGIHIYILNNEGKNAFSFLLNSHHDYFEYNSLFIDNSSVEDLEMLKLKCTKVAFDALRKQIELAEREILN